MPQKKKKGNNNKKIAPTQTKSNQSTKSTMEEGLETKYTLAQAQRLQQKESLSPWTGCPSFSKATLFLSFQTIQKRHRGAPLHTFFLFLPTKEPCHPNHVSLTKKVSTHNTLKRENNKCQRILVILQCNKMQSSDSFFDRHR